MTQTAVNQIFINLPVTDIEASTNFYESLGWSLNPDFSDEQSAYLVINDAIALQLASHDKYKGFTNASVPDPGGVILALGVDSRDDVDRLADTAVASGGSSWKDVTDLGWLYNRGFADPDGHKFEVVSMDMAAVAGDPPA